MLLTHKTRTLGIFFFLFMSIAVSGFSQEKNEEEKIRRHAGELSLGFNAALGYNVINYVDGTLAVIPNKINPVPEPGSPVYSSPISVNIEAPFFSLEYWFVRAWSLKFETGINLMVIGADHDLSDFAYLLTYWKINTGARYYFSDLNVDYLFVGLGWFVNFPIANPWIGFTRSDGHARVDTGPYFEIGMNYPITKLLSVELFGRFYLGLRSLTLKSDPKLLATIAVSPFDIGFGLNWSIL